MADVHSLTPKQFQTPLALRNLFIGLMLAGVVAFAAGLAMDPRRAWAAYLLGLFYSLSLALGGLFFVAIQHVSAAGWSVTIRRSAESFSAFLPVAFGLALLFLVGARHLYK